MKKAVVIGASSGIGEGLAKLLVENDYLVGITGRRADLLIKIKNENPNKYIVKSLDINETENIPQLLEELVNELAGLDLLIICSGIGEINKTLDFVVEKRTIITNVLGFTAIADWSYNYFDSKKKGHLVAISSIAGLRGNRHAPSYSASKSYQISYMEALHQKADNSKCPIYITDLRPGFVDTKMAQGDNLIWVSTVEKAVKQIYKSIQHKRKVTYITKRWAIIALIMKLIPDWIYNKL